MCKHVWCKGRSNADRTLTGWDDQTRRRAGEDLQGAKRVCDHAKEMRTKCKNDGQIACEARRQAAMFVCRSHVHAAARSTSNKTTRPIRKQPPERHVRKRGERAAEVLRLNAALVYRSLVYKSPPCQTEVDTKSASIPPLC
jgi:hypothetical protein